MSEYETQLYRDVISSLLEKSLLELDSKMLSKTENHLKKHNLSFNDALEYPEVIFTALQKTVGKRYPELIRLINDEMRSVSKNPAFEKFVTVLNK
ncbi:MAG: hypothetical protein DWQ18_00740 [Crenarchaeota archaeon]|nr:MAG: hypothetical protein DWQ17_04475 [Thermoproteota archaeon]RDJ34501.1 MAG: hypothetical protein DWQ18_00740 [Thermoproteota archaeon]RDJ38556.1 MAG: hypothetical protein DWQ13_04080 [Thermoproteota archaeon]